MRKPLLLLAASSVLALFSSLAPGPSAAREGYTRNVAIVLWDGAEVLDWAGPTEVFVSAAQFGADRGQPAFHVYTVGARKEAITSQTMVSVTPQYSIEDAPKPDIIVLPGGGGQSVLSNAAMLSWVKTAAHEAEVAMSVCTGAFVLGEAGLLDGHDVTTWYGATDGLARRFPQARVQNGRRFVDNGQFITTAGVSAGIDGSLHLVARLLGRAVADRTAQYMEYHWSPEAYLSGGYSMLNPSLDERGRERQHAQILRDSGDKAAARAAYAQLVTEDATDLQSWFERGRLDLDAADLEAAAEAFRHAAKNETLRARAQYNLACALARATHTDQALDALAAAIDAGYHDAAWARRDADLLALHADPRWEKLLAPLEKAR